MLYINTLRPSDIYMSANYDIIGSDNGFLPVQCQAIIWSNPGLLLIGTNSSVIWIKIWQFSFTKLNLKMSAMWLPFCLSLNVLMCNNWLDIILKLVSADNDYIDGLVQDCSISIANALEIQQSSTRPSINPFHQSHNASEKYSRMDHFVTEMCTHAHFCHKMLHSGIFFWCIVGFMNSVSWNVIKILHHSNRGNP